jgi:diketogulonate reductase-like aldo/keto reductase
LLDSAWDAGIRHFDTARVYGTGDAESVLGEFAKSRRTELTIATKFGIRPIAAGPGGKAAKDTARKLLRRSARLRELARTISRRTGQGGRFTSAEALDSFETSLRELDTDYVDLLLLHDCAPADWAGPELRDALAGLVEAGRIRWFGTATDHARTRTILTGGGAAPAVVQFNSDAQDRNVTDIARLGTDAQLITYRSLGSVFERLSAILRPGADPAQTWSRILDVDVADRGELARLLLAHAIWSNPGGIVLFSSSDPRRIATNAAVARSQPFEPEQLRTLERLIDALPAQAT